MTDKKKNGWMKFVPSLDLPKERVSIAYDTHDERGVRYAYGYFQFYNGTCGCFWKDGNEQPKVVKAEDIKYWMPVPSLDVQEESASEELEKVVEEIVDPTVLNAYGVKEIANRLRRTMIESVSEEQVKESLISKHEDKTCKEKGNSLTQEPVSIDFEQELYKAFGQVKDFTLSMRIAKWFYDMGKNSQEPVSEDLEKEIDSYFAKWLQGASDEGCFNPDSQLVSIYDCHRIARHFANWQKEQIMAKAVKVKVSNASIVSLPVNCNLKVGDKVLIIKED